MTEAIAIYQERIADLPHRDDAWLLETFARARGGDDLARREVSASCLRLAYQIAERASADLPQWSLLDLVQEANAALWEATQTFTGRTGDEFRQFAADRIEQRIASLPVSP